MLMLVLKDSKEDLTLSACPCRSSIVLQFLKGLVLDLNKVQYMFAVTYCRR